MARARSTATGRFDVFLTMGTSGILGCAGARSLMPHVVFTPRGCPVVSDKGGKAGFVYRSRQAVYRALRRQGKSKQVAAEISNAGQTHAERSAMAKKAARTRKRRGGK